MSMVCKARGRSKEARRPVPAFQPTAAVRHLVFMGAPAPCPRVAWDASRVHTGRAPRAAGASGGIATGRATSAAYGRTTRRTGTSARTTCAARGIAPVSGLESKPHRPLSEMNFPWTSECLAGVGIDPTDAGQTPKAGCCGHLFAQPLRKLPPAEVMPRCCFEAEATVTPRTLRQRIGSLAGVLRSVADCLADILDPRQAVWPPSLLVRLRQAQASREPEQYVIVRPASFGGFHDPQAAQRMTSTRRPLSRSLEELGDVARLPRCTLSICERDHSRPCPRGGLLVQSGRGYDGLPHPAKPCKCLIYTNFARRVTCLRMDKPRAAGRRARVCCASVRAATGLSLVQRPFSLSARWNTTASGLHPPTLYRSRIAFVVLRDI